jgi:predicted secreted protein
MQNLLREGETSEMKKTTVRIGEEFSVSLEENGTTGFLWNLDPLPESVHLVSSVFVPAERDHDVVGSGGTRKFVFSTSTAGEFSFCISLQRPWEKVPVDTVEVDVVSVVGP